MKKLILFFCLLCIIYVRPSYADSVKVWAIGDCHKINPVTGKDFNPFVPKEIAKKNYLWDSRTSTITIFGARNEYVSFQIIIEAGKSDLDNVTVVFSDLSGPSLISKKNIELFKEHYTTVWKKSDWPLPSTGPGEYPDALIPFNAPKLGAPFKVVASRNQGVWVDLYIPKNVIPGDYTGSIAIFSNEDKLSDVKLQLSIYDFTLPDENHLIFWSNYGYEMITRDYGAQAGDTKYIAVERSMWKIAHEHRLNALLRHAQIRPGLKKDKYGLITFDYQNYAYRLGPYLSGEMFEDKRSPDIFLLPISGGTEYRWPPRGPADDPDSGFVYACKDIVAYFHEMRWDVSKSYIYISDEPKASNIDKVIHDAGLIHGANKNLKTMVALSEAFNAGTLNKLAGFVDMWLVDGKHYDSKLLLPRKKFGEKVGFYQQGEPWCGNENLDSDGLGFVTWPWIAWKYKVDCVYMYYMNYWGGLEQGHSIWEYPRNQSWSNSQGVMVYPGSYIGITDVVGSIRLKQIRRGMQDYEYMWLAKNNGKDPSSMVNSVIIKALDETKRQDGLYGEWSHNPEDWFIARQNIANLIIGKNLAPLKKVFIPGEVGRLNSQPLKSSLKKNLKMLLAHVPKKLRHLNLLFLGDVNYLCNFDNGDSSGWTGGDVLQQDGGYFLQASSKNKSKYSALEIWKVFPIKKDTKIEFSYFYTGDSPIIVQFWSKTHKKNFYTEIKNPVTGEWAKAIFMLKDINPSIVDSEINSIHIAFPSISNSTLRITNVRLNNVS